MLIGLLSDTHDRVKTAISAVKLLRKHGAEHLLHAGDVGGQLVIDAMVGEPASFVWGNNDCDRDALAAYAGNLSVHCFGSFGEVELGGKRFALTHGDDAQMVKRILREGAHDYLITGHTHITHDRRQGDCRWINPGALHRAAIKTVALLDTRRTLCRQSTWSDSAGMNEFHCSGFR